MPEHWKAGRAGMAHTRHDPRWVNHDRSTTGVHVFALTSATPIGEDSCGMNSDESPA
jgi:NTE family protein